MSGSHRNSNVLLSAALPNEGYQQVTYLPALRHPPAPLCAHHQQPPAAVWDTAYNTCSTAHHSMAQQYSHSDSHKHSHRHRHMPSTARMQRPMLLAACTGCHRQHKAPQVRHSRRFTAAPLAFQEYWCPWSGLLAAVESATEPATKAAP